MRSSSFVVALLLPLTALGCASAITPQAVRSELVRQTGVQPVSEFEFDLGRLTTALLKTTIGPSPDGTLPLAGLSGFALAVYTRGEAASAAAGAPLDLSTFDPWGWEDVLRFRDDRTSALITLRGGTTVVHDLVLVASGPRQVVFARLRGDLPTTLPAVLRKSVESGGTEGVKRQLLDASGREER